MSEQLKRNGPVEALYACSSKGWMNEELFVTWLTHFKKHTSPSEDNPILLLLDNHGSHCSLAAYEFCRKNFITMLSFPPHTSHRLQPLDLTVYGPLKSAYSKECSLFMRNHVHQKITPFDVAEIFNKAFVQIASIDKAQKGFQVSGIVPYNPNSFTEEDFLPASIAKLPVVEDCELPSTSIMNKLNKENKNPDINDTPSTSKEPDATITKKNKANVSFEELTPLNVVASKNLNKRGRKLGISKILTATPEKTELELKEQRKLKRKKTEKVPLPVMKVKKQVFDDSSSSASSYNEKDLCNDHSSEDPMSEDDNDTCLICGEYGKTETWYKCGMCSKWAHKACSGFDSPKNYICDFCSN